MQLPYEQHHAYPAQSAQYAAVAPAYPVARPVGTVHLTFAWVIAVVTLGYMLPWAVAATRQRSNTAAIALVDFLTGWTGIGWIAALIMACGSNTPAGPTYITTTAFANNGPMPSLPPAGWYPDAAGAMRYWDGRAWMQDGTV